MAIKDVELVTASVPTTVRTDGVDRPVVAAAYLPSGPGTLEAHVVVYCADADGDVGLDEPIFGVGLQVYDEDEQSTYLVEGSYDLTYAEALVDFARRLH